MRFSTHLKLYSAFFCIAVVVLGNPSHVRADDGKVAPVADTIRPALFGHRGHLVLGEVIGFETMAPYVSGFAGYSQRSIPTYFSGIGSRQTDEQFWLSPAADYFVTDQLTLGGSIRVAYLHNKWENAVDTSEWKNSELSAMPRLGYVIAVGSGILFWPRVGIGAGYAHSNPSTGPTTSTVQLQGALSAPLVFGLTDHIILKAGPELVATVSKTTEHDTRESSGGSAFRVSLATHLGVVF